MSRLIHRLRERLPTHVGRRTRWIASIVAVLVVLLIAGSFFVDEPLRRQIESRMNERLTGYHVTIGRLEFNPLALSITLRDMVFTQEANPDPPIGDIRRLHAGVHWRALLSGRVVAHFVVNDPKLYVNLKHLRTEASDPEPVQDHGWQEAFQAIYPLKINRLRIVNGEITYVDEGKSDPLELTQVDVVADNIRNIKSAERTYPSPVHVKAVVFKTGALTLDGQADFLAVPHPGIKADVTLEKIDLDHFKSITKRYDVTVNGGQLSAAGALEYGKEVRVLDLQQATVRGVQVEYTHTPAQKGAVQAATAKTAEKAREVANEPDLLLRARQVSVVDSTFSVVNRAVTPAYRVFIDRMNLTLKDFSNQQTEAPMSAKLTGRFMGSGPAQVSATFRPEKAGPDFDLTVSLEETDLRTLNDVLRAYGRFDVAGGTFALYSEMKVKHNHIDGYVKPLFSNLDVYDPVQDKDKSFPRKIYERVVEGVAKVLKNTPRKEVATVASLSGPVENVKANTVEVVVKLLQNAFFKAILPGFDREAHIPSRR